MTELPYKITKTLSEPNAAEFICDSYIIHKKPSRCDRCGAEHTSCEVFEVQVHATRGIRRLVPAKQVTPEREIGLATLQAKTLPACHLCFESLPQPNQQFYDSEAAWRNAVKRKQALLHEERRAKATTPQKIEPTLDEL